MKYRAEIDGLRSLAIFPVLMFHAGLGVFTRGHMGVDIFFVISGYLITGLILADVDQKKFSLRNFYMRRARRLLPALFLLLLVSCVAAWLMLFPADMQDFGKSLLSALTFTANFYFWQTGDYFASSSALRPLLHLWSLGIEEQFYLLFPWLLVSATGIVVRDQRRIWVSVCVVLSLLLACKLTSRAPMAAFYLPLTRAWELLAGALAAWYSRGAAPAYHLRSWQPWAAWLGLLMVLGVLSVPYSLPWPVLTVTAPLVAGTVLMLSFARDDVLVARLLRTRPLVWVGLLSYSAYLWHQPLFAFARHGLINLAGITAWVGIGIVLLLSWLSWRWVEQPFRGKCSKVSNQAMLRLVLGGGLVFSCFAAIAWCTNGMPGRYTSQELAMVSYSQANFNRFTVGYRVGDCFLDEHTTVPHFGDACGVKEASDWLVWGDSHAAALYQGFSIGPSDGVRWAQYTASGCPPLLEFQVDWRPYCVVANRLVLEKVREAPPRVIVLHANWLLYGIHNLEVEIEKTLRTLHQAAPNSQIVVLGGVPQWEPSLPIQLLRREGNWERHGSVWMINRTLESVIAMDHQLAAGVDHAGGGKDAMTFVSAIDILCERNRCPVTAEIRGEWMPFAWDYGHMTTAGGYWFAQKLLPSLQKRAAL